MSMTDEQAFAWLRSLVAPNVQQITVYDDPIIDERIVKLEGATPEQIQRVQNTLGLRYSDIRWKVTA